MSGVFKRLMNVVTIILVLLTVYIVIFTVYIVPNYPWSAEEIVFVSMSWIFVLVINYIFFKKLTIWHRDS